MKAQNWMSCTAAFLLGTVGSLGLATTAHADRLARTSGLRFK